MAQELTCDIDISKLYIERSHECLAAAYQNLEDLIQETIEAQGISEPNNKNNPKDVDMLVSISQLASRVYVESENISNIIKTLKEL